MRRSLTVLGAAALLVGGCVGETAPLFRPIRPAALEVPAEQGRWRVDDAAAASLERAGWRVSFTKSQVAVGTANPRLETLIFVISNTDRVRPLVIEPGEVLLVGINETFDLSPAQTRTLQPGESITLGWQEGLRAPLMPHPFRLEITVFRGPNFAEPDRLRLDLY